MIGVGDGSYSLVVARSMAPVARQQLEFLKGAEKHQTDFHVIGATRPGVSLGGPSVSRAQKALEEQLRAGVPRILQGHIRGVLQAERVGRENQATILAQHR